MKASLRELFSELEEAIPLSRALLERAEPVVSRPLKPPVAVPPAPAMGAPSIPPLPPVPAPPVVPRVEAPATMPLPPGNLANLFEDLSLPPTLAEVPYFPPPEPPVPEPPASSLPAGSTAAVVAPIPSRASGAFSLPPLDLSGTVGRFGAGIWDVVLEWTRTATRASAAFLVDTDGLVITISGELPAPTVELMAPPLLMAHAQLLGMIQPFGGLEGLACRLGDRWITTFNLQLPGNLPLTLGVLGPAPVDPFLRQEIETALVNAFRA